MSRIDGGRYMMASGGARSVAGLGESTARRQAHKNHQYVNLSKVEAGEGSLWLYDELEPA